MKNPTSYTHRHTLSSLLEIQVSPSADKQTPTASGSTRSEEAEILRPPRWRFWEHKLSTHWVRSQPAAVTSWVSKSLPSTFREVGVIDGRKAERKENTLLRTQTTDSFWKLKQGRTAKSSNQCLLFKPSFHSLSNRGGGRKRASLPTIPSLSHQKYLAFSIMHFWKLDQMRFAEAVQETNSPCYPHCFHMMFFLSTEGADGHRPCRATPKGSGMQDNRHTPAPSQLWHGPWAQARQLKCSLHLQQICFNKQPVPDNKL